MNAVQARKIIVSCCDMIDRIKKERTDILEKQEQYKSKLQGLEKDLGAALVRAMFSAEVPAEVNLIRKSIRDKTAFLADADLILSALNLLETEKKEQKKDPQRIVRADGESRRQKELNMQLQQQLLAMASESENFMHHDDFKNVAERFRKNAMSLDQEQAADDFLKTLRG